MMEKRIIEKMVKAMEIEINDKVLLNFWGEEDDLEDLQTFEEVLKETNIAYQILTHMSKDYALLFNDRDEALEPIWYQQFDDVTIVIDLICQTPGLIPHGLAEEKIPLFGDHLQKIFGVFSKKKKMIQITMPTKKNAEFVGMDVDLFCERTIKALDIDYTQMKKDCQEKVEAFKGCTRTIRTGENCALTIDTTDRQWYVDAGDGALPCGEIYIAPVEENTQGTIFFKTLAVEGVGVYENVTLTIQNGRVVSSDCEAFDAFVKELPEGGDIVAELGIGMNPNVELILGDSHLDENALGTLHIAIGMNHLFGGKNMCPTHYDFVTTGVVE